jgi:hypothetical protein
MEQYLSDTSDPYSHVAPHELLKALHLPFSKWDLMLLLRVNETPQYSQTTPSL